MLSRVERPRAAAGRMEVVGDDHVVRAVSSLDVPARIGRNEMEAGADVGREGAREELRGLDDLGQELDGVYLDARFLCGRGRGVAGANAKKKRTSRRRVKQHGQQGLPTIDSPACVGAFLLPVVDAQPRHPARVLDDADRSRDSVAVADHPRSCGQIYECQRGSEGRERRTSCEGQPRPRGTPSVAGAQKHVAAADRKQGKLRPQRGYEQDPKKNRRDCGTERVDANGPAERDPGALRLVAQVAEQRAHYRRRKGKCQQRERGLGRERRTKSSAAPL